jgi:glucose-6-phosphate 1-epimerase
MQSIQQLNARYGVGQKIHFYSDQNGLVTVHIENPHASAKIALQGAHVMEWQPHHSEEPVLWLSDQARFVRGRSIRGGVPVCWPWFGAHATDESLCPHGFARVAQWKIVDTVIDPDGATRIIMQLIETQQLGKQWPHHCEVTLTVIVGSALRMQLTTTNTGTAPFVLGEALHTYFHVSDIEVIKISGLDNTQYQDKVEGYAVKQQQGDIRFTEETDRVYINTESTCVIEDPGLRRRITVQKSGSKSTVVWNPWGQKAAEIGDLGSHSGWRHMVCVESANATDNVVTVAPGEVHTLEVEYSTEYYL